MKNRDIKWNWEEDAQKDVKRKFSSQETQNSAPIVMLNRRISYRNVIILSYFIIPINKLTLTRSINVSF